MARPRKSEVEAAGPTAERILKAAIDLFSKNGFEGVSVRDIAKQAGLTEAALYTHYQNKAALLDAALDWLVSSLIEPNLSADPAVGSAAEGEKSVEAMVLEGAARFFGNAGPEAMQTWRILMLEQYRNPKARDFLHARVLAQPRARFVSMLEELDRRGRIRPGIDCAAAGACLAALFFEFSFAANLGAAWQTPDPARWETLRAGIRFLARAIEKPRDPGAPPTTQVE